MFYLYYAGLGLFFNFFVALWIIRRAYKKYEKDGVSMEGLVRQEFIDNTYILVYVGLIWPFSLPIIGLVRIWMLLGYVYEGFVPFLTKMLLLSHKNNNPEDYV